MSKKLCEFSLSNGIPVVMQNLDGHVASIYWWVQTGSADERRSEAGFAHFLEHMLFKDTSAKITGRPSTGQTTRAIESLGGDINAYTSFEQTVYHVTCADQHFEKVIRAFGSMAKPQRFLKTDFEREREVILEELRRSEDSPERQLFQELFSKTYPTHAYGKPVIGNLKNLKRAEVKELEGFYRRQYVPLNMGLVVVGSLGDVDDSNPRVRGILKLLEKDFGNIRRSKRTLKSSGAQRTKGRTPQRNSCFSIRPFDVKTPSMALSFRVPDLTHDHVPALDLLASILSMGELSRLYQSLFYKRSLVTDVSGALYVPRDPGMIYFNADYDDVEKSEEVAKAFFEEFRRLGDEGVLDEELERVFINAESERLYSTQTTDGMASRLGFLRFVLGDLDFDRRYLERLRGVGREEIQNVAKTYFCPEKMSGVFLFPKEVEVSKSLLKSIDRCSEQVLKFKKPKVTSKKREAKSSFEIDVRVDKRSSGIQVVHVNRASSHVFSIHASALGGLRLEVGNPLFSREEDWGTSYFNSLTWTKGTSQKNAHEISQVIEGRAAALEGFSGRNATGLELTGLARDWDSLSQVFSEVLVDPSFPNEEIEHTRRIARESLKGLENHSSQLCNKLFLEALFESHPYGRLSIGSDQSIEKMNQEKMLRYHRAWIHPERLTLSVVGSVDRSRLDSWLTELEEVFERKGKEQEERKAFPASLPESTRLKAPRWVEKSLKREQTHLIVGGHGIRMHDPERHALRLLQTLLGGQSGSLFIELREKRSLAYTVAPVGFEGIERGFVGTYVACSPSKKEEAVRGIRRVLEKIAEKGPSDREVSRAKAFYLGRRAMDLQSDPSMAAFYGLQMLYGYDVQNQNRVREAIEGVGKKEIQDVCRRFLVEQPMVTACVG